MTHLTAATEATAAGRRSDGVRMFDRLDRTARRVSFGRVSIFRSSVANFLEPRRAGFHYSATDGCTTESWTGGIAGGCPLGAIPLTMKSQRRTSNIRDRMPAREGVLDPAPPHEAVITYAWTEPVRSRFQTDIRKTYANGSGFSHTMQVDVSVTNGRMMRICEKLSRDVSQYAMVAPILHRSVRTDPSDRGTTLSKGAAE